MRSRILIGALVLVGVLAAATIVARGSAMAPSRQSVVAIFQEPMAIAGTIVQGRVLIVHDHEKMAHGDACTTIYRYQNGKRRQELVSFMCRPVQRPLAKEFRVVSTKNGLSGTQRMLEYQFSGDTEAHGVPAFR